MARTGEASARMVTTLVNHVRSEARAKRARIFLEHFEIRRNTRILDIGSENGTHIASVLAGTPVSPANVHIADIDPSAVQEGYRRFGFTPVHIPEAGRLPFEDGFFDIVYCSSVIEHVTVPKSEIWTLRDGAEFERRAWARQQEFAREIVRLGKGYFVQTPCRSFPIESHSWLPFVAYIPRRALVPLLEATNRVWIKKTTPDWHLLSEAEMRRLFPDATIAKERLGGFTKSLMAIRAP
ncbi:MAG: class I SAM-dependent methyltransferase [Gammaproteobacteria bacterium]